jgi:hypothetical protein
MAMAEAERPQPQPPSPLEMLRDRRAVVDTGLGPVAFVTANAIWDLETAAYVAIGLAVVVAAFRLLRREPLTNAVGGILGTGLCVFIALRTGDASGYFIPRMLQNAGMALGFGGSALFKRPLVGFIAAALFRGFPSGWYRDVRIRRPFAEATLAFAALFALRAILYAILIAAGREGALAATSIALGWPAFLGVVWFTWRYVPRRLAQLGIDPDELRHGPREP